MTTKSECQPASDKSVPPSVGASAGATPSMMPIRLRMRAEACPVNWSRTMAREIDMPAAAPMPCTERATSSQPIEPEKVAMALPTR